MKPLEVWTCQKAEKLKKKSSKIPKSNYAATMVSAPRRQIIGRGGPPQHTRRAAPSNCRRRRGATGARLYQRSVYKYFSGLLRCRIMVIIILITVIIIVIIIIIIIITTIYMAPRSRTEVEGRSQNPQTLSSPVSRWILRMRVAHHRTFFFSGVEPQSVGTHLLGGSLNTKLHSTPLLCNC